jgi:hypothetical protein
MTPFSAELDTSVISVSPPDISNRPVTLISLLHAPDCHTICVDQDHKAG